MAHEHAIGIEESPMKRMVFQIFAALIVTVATLVSPAFAQAFDLSADNSDSVAIIIGNKDYKRTVPVDFAQNDAAAMRDFLVGKMGFRDTNVFVLQNATLNEFNQMFGTEKNPQSGQLWRAAKQGRSNIFVYYSGHGVPDLASKQPFLLPADGDPNTGESGYLLDTLYRNLELVKQKVGADRQVIVMIDACFTGETGRKGESLLAVSAPGFTPALPKTGDGIVKLLATSASTPANWDEDNQLGLFTSRFLLASAGLAADDKGLISWRDLAGFVREDVQQTAQRQSGRAQMPEIDDAAIRFKANGPVALVERGYGMARDEANWNRAKAENSVSAFEDYIARCGTSCGYKDQAISALAGFRNAGEAESDAEAWKALSADGKYQDYLDQCGAVCAYREIAENYLAQNDPNRDRRVRLCDKLAAGPYDADRPKDVKRVCGAKIDTKAAIKACTEAVKAFPKLGRVAYQLGRTQDFGGDYKAAFEAYSQAKDLGSIAAINNLATLYEYGQGTKKDLKKAAQLYRSGADQGGPTAMSNLARFLEYGLAGKKNVPEAAQWYKKCSDAGDPFCSTKYANMVMSQVPGAKGDGLQSILAISRAADQGETMAMVALATIVDLGFGNSLNNAKPAVEYLQLALKRGERGAIAVAVPAVFTKLKPKTRKGLQDYLAKQGAYDGAIDGELNPGFVKALKAFAIQEQKKTPDDFFEESEACD
jgi:TPR repeat protein